MPELCRTDTLVKFIFKSYALPYKNEFSNTRRIFQMRVLNVVYTQSESYLTLNNEYYVLLLPQTLMKLSASETEIKSRYSLKEWLNIEKFTLPLV